MHYGINFISKLEDYKNTLLQLLHNITCIAKFTCTQILIMGCLLHLQTNFKILRDLMSYAFFTSFNEDWLLLPTKYFGIIN